MYQLKELIEIDRRFQNSVNLQLDIDRKDKIDSYIPTRSTDRILGHYLKNIEKSREKATLLIGPYGKGKSHLLLVLLNWLKQRARPFLPILVSGNYEELSQAFLMGMIDALKREGLESLAPDSYYSKAVEKICDWEQNYPDAYQMFSEAAQGYGQTGEKVKKQLCRLNKKALQIFREIYSKITFGGNFTPMIEMETTRLYEEICQKLSDEYHYGGIFIIFDEFSKYIEGHDRGTFARDMKIIQDMCELASSLEEPQIHIALVAHKSIKEYAAAMPKEMIHAFTGVEGRLKEILFVVSSQNNYELMERVIKKAPGYWEAVRQCGLYLENALESFQLECFRALFEEEDFQRIIVKGCFPLMPLTAYLLLQISEKAAQNERSVFTFLANDEKGTLYRHCHNAGTESEKWPVTAEVVYDYFENIFREDAGQTKIHEEWLKADFALTKTKEEDEQRVIKTMALFGMLQRSEGIPAKEQTICLALNMSRDKCSHVFRQLEQKQIIRFMAKSHSYVFVNYVGVDLEKEIRETEAKLPANLEIAQTLGRIFELDYILPKLHNQEFTISRFFEYIFLTSDQFFKLSDAKVLFEEHFADGKIVAILREDGVDEKEIQKKLQSLSDSRIIVILPEQNFHQEKKVKRLLAVEKLLEDEEFLEHNPVIIQELTGYKEDIVFEINHSLCRDYDPSRGSSSVFYQGDIFRNGFQQNMTFNSFLSKICTEYYGQAPRINNELINRQHISAQNKKARKKIISMILSKADCSIYERGTGPEATIYRAVLFRTGVRGDAAVPERGCHRVLEEIDTFITQCDGQKTTFAKLYQRLMGRGYGIRRGILPIYLANQFVKLSDSPVIYFKEREVCAGADVFENINKNPQDYFLYVEHKTVQKEQYLGALEQLFFIKKKRQGLEQIVEGMQRWYRGLPQITLNFNRQPEGMEKQRFEEIRRFRKLFRQVEPNPRELLFERLPEIFGEDDLLRLVYKIEEVKNYLDQYLESTRQAGIGILKETFGGKSQETLPACLNYWYAKQSAAARTFVSNNHVTAFMNYAAKLSTYDENEIFGRISKIVLDLYVEDWTDDSPLFFREALCRIRNEIEEVSARTNDTAGKKHIQFTGLTGEKIEKYYDITEDDAISNFLKNAIEGALDEFGDSLEINQKVSVLVQTLEQLIRQ